VIEVNNIYNMDCLEGMKLMEDDIVNIQKIELGNGLNNQDYPIFKPYYKPLYITKIKAYLE